MSNYKKLEDNMINVLLGRNLQLQKELENSNKRIEELCNLFQRHSHGARQVLDNILEGKTEKEADYTQWVINCLIEFNKVISTTQPHCQSATRLNFVSPLIQTALPSPLTTQSSSTLPMVPSIIEIPMYCGKNTKLNTEKKFTLVLAICGTDRIDDVDRNLVNHLYDNGFANVVVIVLRKCSDSTKVKLTQDPTINSGASGDKVMLQLVHNKGQILKDDSTKYTTDKLLLLLEKVYELNH